MLMLDFKSVIRLIDQICKQLNVSYYLIGAQARNIHLWSNHIHPGRATLDIDFALSFAEMESFEAFKAVLVENGFRKINEPYRMMHEETGIVVDLLPFGNVENNGIIHFQERNMDVSVLGLKELLPFVKQMEWDNLEIYIPPLEGLVVLKLLAYSENNDRKKDLDDIKEILVHYFDIHQERFFEHHTDVVDELDESNFILYASARLLGRDLKKICSPYPHIELKVIQLLTQELQEKPGKITSYFLMEGYFKSFEEVQQIIKQLLKGLQE
jgi:predicted nucleotidyltransferase